MSRGSGGAPPDRMDGFYWTVRRIAGGIGRCYFGGPDAFFFTARHCS